MSPRDVLSFIGRIFARQSSPGPAQVLPSTKTGLDPSAARSRRLAARASLSDEECIKRREARRQYRRFARRRRLVEAEDQADLARHSQ